MAPSDHLFVLEVSIRACSTSRGAACYFVPDRYTFVSRPETNSIELLLAGERIVYDLKRFYADSSRRRIHKEFLSFIRLHHGLTLQTRER